MISLLMPNWQVPDKINAVSTTRLGGVSLAPYASLNLGDHMQDEPANVAENRLLLQREACLPTSPVWLKQVHGVEVLTLTANTVQGLTADAAYTRHPGTVCTIMTADCLPVLFCSRRGDEVAAAHAGWRGLCHGILEQTVSRFACRPDEIIVWLGPAIGPDKFEVGAEVRQAFLNVDPQAADGFIPYQGKYLANIYLLARQRLHRLGVKQISGGDYCTVSDPTRFFSYRRDGETGRMASLIWIK